MLNIQTEVQWDNTYIAIDRDSYEADYQGEDEDGHHWKESPKGSGKTKEEAEQDLLCQMFPDVPDDHQCTSDCRRIGCDEVEALRRRATLEAGE